MTTYMTSETRPPIHESLEVVRSEDIYQNEEWWKGVVQYKFDQDNDYTEVAVYLWHNDDDDEWVRKNKYVIKTLDAWKTDREVIESLLEVEEPSTAETDFPVSDYYHTAAGVTVFQSDDWWKAILLIDEKGSYETEEIMVYLWQRTEDGWRRRQKYTIKDRESWEEERQVIESVLGIDDGQPSSQSQATQNTPAEEPATESQLEIGEGIAELDAELEAHLSDSLE